MACHRRQRSGDRQPKPLSGPLFGPLGPGLEKRDPGPPKLVCKTVFDAELARSKEQEIDETGHQNVRFAGTGRSRSSKLEAEPTGRGVTAPNSTGEENLLGNANLLHCDSAVVTPATSHRTAIRNGLIPAAQPPPI